jgi:hypothetical protein
MMDAMNVVIRAAWKPYMTFLSKDNFMMIFASKSRTAIFALHNLLGRSDGQKMSSAYSYTHMQISSDLVQRTSLLPITTLNNALSS